MSHAVKPPTSFQREKHRPSSCGSGVPDAGITAEVLLIGAVAAGCFAGGAWAFSSVAPEAYMDEVFHVPQTQAYCRGDYGRWDPKITTLPGLYVFAMGYARLVTFARGVVGEAGLAATSTTTGGTVQDVCAVGVLRQVNWAFSLGTLAVMRALLLRRMAPGKALAHAVLLWLYPVSFFFSFLFYTDPGATFFALLCYLLATGRPRGGRWIRRFGSSLVGGVSVLFRQTNAVWVAFTLAICLLEDFTPLVVAASDDRGRSGPVGAGAVDLAAADVAGGSVPSSPSPRLPSAKSTTSTRQRRNAPDRGSSSCSSRTGVVVSRSRGRSEDEIEGKGTGARNSNGDDVDVTDAGSRLEQFRLRLPPTPRLLLLLAKAALGDLGQGAPLLRGRAPLAVPVALFAVFVWGFNGGAVVVGDKENHSPGGPPHLAQLAYLAAVTASLWGVVGGREAITGGGARKGFVEWVKRTGVATVTAIVAAVAVAVARYSLAHPFLLADNRHYPFYVWRRLLSNLYVRVALAPVYVLCGWLVSSRLLQRKPLLWVLTFAGAAAVVLVPSPLVEPRYLTIPVLLTHLESAERSWKSLLVGAMTCAAVNAATIYVFLWRPFEWHDGSLARFMW